MSRLDRDADRAAATERDHERGILERPAGAVSRPFDDLREEKRRVDAASVADEWRAEINNGDESEAV